MKQAVAVAGDFARQVLEPERVRDLRLEEIDLRGQKHKQWVVTLSMGASGGLNILGREYKTFVVDVETGNVP